MHELLRQQLSALSASQDNDALFQAISECYADFEAKLKAKDAEIEAKTEQSSKDTLKVESARQLLEWDHQALSAVFDAAGEAILAFDKEGRLTRCNQLGRDFISAHYGQRPIKERDLLSICSDTKSLKKTFSSIAENPLIHTHGIMYSNRGQQYQFRCSPKVVSLRLQGRVWCFRDVTAQRSVDEIIRFQALHDALTCLPNRTALGIKLKEEMDIHRSEGKQFAVLFIDLGGLKQINDTQGHDVGDSILISVAVRIHQTIREDDIFVRYSGDEFIVVMRFLDNITLVDKACAAIQSAISEPLTHENNLFYLSSTIGVSLYDEHGLTTRDLVRNADLAMYHARTNQKSVQFYNKLIAAEELQKIETEKALRQAIDEQELVLYFQPKVDAASLQIVSAEGLIRWIKPDGTVVSPQVFIPVAEKSGLIRRIGRLVILQACAQLAHWKACGLGHLFLSINLSAADLNDPDIVTYIVDKLREYGVCPSRLILEVTESLFMGDKDYVSSVMSQLQGVGIHFALDDFGTGYSSLSYLQSLPFSYLKIDRSFLSDLISSPKQMAIVQTVMDIGRNLGLKLVAEGVEDTQTLEFITQRAPEGLWIQGFLFYKPMPMEAMMNLLQPQLSEQQ